MLPNIKNEDVSHNYVEMAYGNHCEKETFSIEMLFVVWRGPVCLNLTFFDVSGFLKR